MGMRFRVLFSGIAGATLSAILVISVLSVLPTNIETEETLLPGQKAEALTVGTQVITYILSTKMTCVENTIVNKMVGSVDFEMQFTGSDITLWDIELLWRAHDSNGNHLGNAGMTLLDSVGGSTMNSYRDNFTPLTVSWSLPSHLDAGIGDVGLFQLKFTESTGPTSLNKVFRYPSCTQDIS